jgi:hypothetical protein
MPPATGRSSQGLFVLLAIVAVLVVGGGAYALTSGDDDDGNGSPTEIDQVPGGEGTGGSAPQEEVGPPTPPPSGVPELDDLAQGCFEGSMEDCDTLFMQAINLQFENETAINYTIYSESGGGRRAATASLNSCRERVPNP